MTTGTRSELLRPDRAGALAEYARFSSTNSAQRLRRSSLARVRIGLQTRQILLRESAGVVTAVLLGMVVLAHLVSTPRVEILFFDGDSLLFPLVHASLAAGQAQQWVLSSPLFLPEGGVYLAIAATGLPTRAALLLDGLVNWVALYAAIRTVATLLRVRRSTAIGSTMLAVAVFSAAALCESSASHDALEPASLTATTTYYSSTVIAAVATTGLLARALRRPTARTLLPLGALIGFAVFSNPLFIAWAVVPLLLVTTLTLTCGTRPSTAFTTIAVTLSATGLGMLARLPLSSLLVQDNAAKIRPDLAAQSATYYAALLHERLASPGGLIEATLLLVLTGTAAIATVLAIRQRWPVGTIIAATACVTPIAVTGGAIALGTFAARYLQPVAFSPVLAVLAFPLLRPHLRRRSPNVPLFRRRLILGLSAGVLTVLLAGYAAPTLVSAATTHDGSLDCVRSWLTRHPRQTGAGQYWTIRAPKTYAAPRPSQLLQVDSAGTGYAWLTNDDDFAQHRYSFTITDSASAPFTGPLATIPAQDTRCGAYTIHDYAPQTFDTGSTHH